MNLSMHRAIRSNEIIVIDTPVSHKTSKKNALSPCDGYHNKTKCGDEEIACPAYKVYASNQGTICSPEVWKNESRTPTARIFNYVWQDKTGRP